MSKILIVTTVPETLDTILRYQPRFLANHFQVSLATSPGERFEQVAHNEGLDLFQVPMVRGINALKDLISIFLMIGVLRKVKPTIVHSYTPKAGLVCMLAAWICRVPVRIHTFTGLVFPTERGFRQKLLIWVDRLLCACATHVIPEGAGVKNDLQRFRITGKSLKLIGHGNIAGVDSGYYSALAPGLANKAARLRKSLAISADSFLFCFVGRLNKDKGLDELIEAFKVLPEKSHLLLVGALDSTAPISAITLKSIESHPRIHCLGFLDDIRPSLLASDVLVLPSYREGFPNVLLQAGAMELPVIATDINGSNEVIEPGRNGWLVPVRNSTALAEAMLRAMQTPIAVRNELGRQSRILMQHRFEQKKHWGRMVTFYQALLDRCSK